VFVGKGAGYSFDLEDLLRASAEVLGKGSVGTSYKAVLEEGTTVVVKRLKDVAVARREFDAHMEALGRVEHRNVLPVRAYYFSKDEKLLVYDYLPNGSLSAMLHGQCPHNLFLSSRSHCVAVGSRSRRRCCIACGLPCLVFFASRGRGWDFVLFAALGREGTTTARGGDPAGNSKSKSSSRIAAGFATTHSAFTNYPCGIARGIHHQSVSLTILIWATSDMVRSGSPRSSRRYGVRRIARGGARGRGKSCRNRPALMAGRS
jgi:hypothetical protein